MTFGADEARRSIFLDFEGEGRNNKSPIPLPHMLGIFRPNPKQGGGCKYEAVFFRESWTAPANGSGGKACVAEFEQTIKGLTEEAKSSNRYLVYWSDHERVVIELNAPQLLDAFQEVGFNLLPPLRKLANSRGIQLDESIDKILNQYIQAFLPNLSQVKEFQPGPAEACRRIDAQSTQVTRWRSWPEKSKEYVKNILEYNEEDCRATWLLGKKLGNVNDNKNKA